MFDDDDINERTEEDPTDIMGNQDDVDVTEPEDLKEYVEQFNSLKSTSAHCLEISKYVHLNISLSSFLVDFLYLYLMQ